MSRMMEYKGYHASVDFDAEDRIFIGKVFGIVDSLNFHGTSVDELESMFHQSIDNYLDMCTKYGKEPNKEYKGSFNVRLSPELHRALVLKAKNQNKTLNQYVVNALETYICDKETTKEIICMPYGVNQIDWNPNRGANSIYAEYDNVIPLELKKRNSFVKKDGLANEN